MKAILGVLVTMVAWGASAAPIPVILDTDIGDDIDDTWALAMLLGMPQFDVKLIVTAHDDTPTKTRLTAKLLDRMGKTQIPIGTGVKTSDARINQAQWLGDYSLDVYPGKVIEDGVGAMIDVLEAALEPVTLIVIGPQTNIAELVKRDPGIASKVARVVTMAGSVHVGYDGAPKPQPEYNVFKNVDAAKAVFAAPWEVVMAPLDICGTLRIDGERYQALVDSTHPRAQAVIQNYDAWTNRKHHPAGSSSVLFDTVAIYLAAAQDLCEIETIKLVIDEKGSTIPDESGRPVKCALRWKDRAAFEALLTKSLTE